MGRKRIEAERRTKPITFWVTDTMAEQIDTLVEEEELSRQQWIIEVLQLYINDIFHNETLR